MADPTDKVRRGVKERDGERCVSCGTAWGLTYQHRQAASQGGAADYANGLAACVVCNGRYEADMQSLALLNGWKVRGWVDDPARVPYYHVASNCWFAVAADGPWRRRITRAEAVAMMRDVYGDGFLRGGRSGGGVLPR
ncbi:hypothetical protein K8F61_17295 [Microbacterium resistens]|uniref:HNH endonuclease n=1 Tax=Microbacterium resistens TaxID=156977 RepID=A0ABY3RTS0_9MICO|nr:hypothetical protein [Microbacterium resistens]UGS26360.1 hypothetical protein K8F61_17295 [Microbacterium resistens]